MNLTEDIVAHINAFRKEVEGVVYILIDGEEDSRMVPKNYTIKPFGPFIYIEGPGTRVMIRDCKIIEVFG